MSRAMVLALLTVAAAFNTSWGQTLGPATWNQIHSDQRNSGFNAVRTGLVGPHVKRWSTAVDPLSYSSPALGPDGVVYIGNLKGQAIAINPNGTQRWRNRLGTSIVATPAVHMGTGEIIVVVQNPLTPTAYASFLYRLSPAGQTMAVSTEQNLFTTSAPKVWREYVFLQTGVRYGQNSEHVSPGHIYVFDRASLRLVAKATPPTCGHPVCGEGPEVFEYIKFLGRCFPIWGIWQEYCTSFEGRPGPTQEPSVAIIDTGNAVEDPDRPIVLATNGFCAGAMRFDPTAAADQRFRQLWGRKLVGDCDDPVRCTSPAVIVSPAIIFGTQAIFADHKGRVTSLNVRTGAEFWKHDFDKAVQWAPVAFLRQIYLVTENKLIVLDGDGRRVHEMLLQGTGRAAALSLEHVHVATSAGIQTFHLNPQQAFIFDGTIAGTGGLSTRSVPVLARDGTLYVSTSDGFIHAYGRVAP